MPEESSLKVSVQGLNKMLNYTGSYDEIFIGEKNYEEVVSMLDSIINIQYPPETMRGDLCLVGVFIERDGTNLCIYYDGNGEFTVRIIDKYYDIDEFLAESVKLGKVLDYLEKYYRGEPLVKEKRTPGKITFKAKTKRCIDGNCEKMNTIVNVDERRFDDIENTRIVKAEFRRGGFLRKPKIIIEYVDENGDQKRIVYEVNSNDELEKIYRETRKNLREKTIMK